MIPIAASDAALSCGDRRMYVSPVGYPPAGDFLFLRAVPADALTPPARDREENGMAIVKLDALTVTRVLELIREPLPGVTGAMAEHVAAARKRNGHGEHSYRDMWQAGIDYLIRRAGEVVA